MHKNRSFFFLLVFLVILLPFHAQARQNSQVEPLINSYLASYAFSPDNLFKLAVYTELKGNFETNSRSIELDFGGLGHITFFPNNCLFRTSGKVYSLSRRGQNPLNEVSAINQELSRLFENIALLANHNADPEKVAFVDESLARKNIEPFNKIFVRHILINYGRFDAAARKVEFHTDWLPPEARMSLTEKEEMLIKKYRTPLKIRLDDNFLRGFYIYSGGTVYVEDVDRNVKYATGEEFDPNVSAFKVFVQKLFVQSAQYIAQNENRRLAEANHNLLVVNHNEKGELAVTHQTFAPPNSYAQPGSDRFAKSKRGSKPNGGIEPLYHRYNWINMMLGVLREQNISIADPEILAFLIDKPYFDKIYARLTPEERKAVDRTRRR
jgi:hypothetical protein